MIDDLKAAVIHASTYDLRRKDGTTLRDEFEQAGETVDDPIIPLPGQAIWAWFWQLNQSRENNGFDVLPISNQELLAWCQTRKVKLLDWEYEAFRSMDGAYLRVVRELSKQESEDGRSSESRR